MSKKQPGKVFRLANSIRTLNNLATIEAVTKFPKPDTHFKSTIVTNGHKPELNFRTVVQWIVTKASVSELESLELITKNTKLD